MLSRDHKIVAGLHCFFAWETGNSPAQNACSYEYYFYTRFKGHNFGLIQ